MNKASSIVILLVIAVILLSVGMGLGIFYQIKKDGPKTERANLLLKQLSSNVIPSVAAYGKVASIDGKKITLSASGENLVVGVSDSSQFYSFVTDSTGGSVQQAAKFEDIKVGDNLNISMKILSDGQLESQAVIILPSK